MAEPPQDVVNLFHDYSDNGVMSVEMLHKFLLDYQSEDMSTLEDAQAILNNLNRLHVFPRRGLHIDDFFRYLFGDLNPPLALLGVHQDMKAPLAHYFMFTGHNSYLTGNQLSSNSSIDPIINALRRGVRVIELDLWPKGDDVQVCHGGTMTSPVKLIKCLEAIRENAFCSSEYPVIITFEDHLNPPLQRKVAEMVNSTFGDMLYPAVEFLNFPSPESLKNKVLISTKPPKESVDSLKEHANNEEKQIEIDNEEEEEGAVPGYIDLIAIHAVKHKGGLENLLKDESNRVARLSLSEQKLQTAVRQHGSDIVRFTQRNLLRVYPKGSRIFSSNYDPLIAWTHGAQMVAFNMQGYGKHLWLMQGMFRANGGCGYVKKPDILLNVGPNNKFFDPNTTRQVKKTLKVKVYMGDGWHLEFRGTHFDPFSPPDFFTKVQILGVPADTKKVKTKAVEDQWVPIWNEEFEFPLTVPELALLRVEVREYDMGGKHDFGGQTCLPVSEMRSGVRAIPLYDRKGEMFKHLKLLMRFQFIETNF